MRSPSNAIIIKKEGLDVFFGMFNCQQIPTKQDRFEAVNGAIYKIVNGEYVKIENEKLYLKKDSNNSLSEFTKLFQENLESIKEEELPYKKDIMVEVIISVYTTEKRFKTVDVDNLAKAILDCLKGIIFEEDSQLVNLLVKKYVHQKKPKDGLFIGVRKIKDHSESWFKDIKLFRFQYI
jgi:Holliday junction resolvase RusA-like endonuclease